eukprot:3018559-Rhodomonas_salina.1
MKRLARARLLVDLAFKFQNIATGPGPPTHSPTATVPVPVTRSLASVVRAMLVERLAMGVR